MRAAVLFAGIGGWEIACEANGVDVAWSAEWDYWKRERYRERWPGADLYRDVAEIDGADMLARHGPIDILLGSPPCTDISAANVRGAGIDGDNSRYYLEAIRLARETGARWIGFENSPRIRTRGADRVLDLLGDAGYARWPCVVEAEDAGAPHERGRSFVLGCRRDAIEGADAERMRVWQQQGWRGRQGRTGEAFDTAHVDADKDRQPYGTEHGAVEGCAGVNATFGECRKKAADAGQRETQSSWRLYRPANIATGRLDECTRRQLRPWDRDGYGLAGYLYVADGLANRLRGHGLSDRAVKAELARWRSALGDALVIPVVWAVVRAIVRTDAQLAPEITTNK